MAPNLVIESDEICVTAWKLEIGIQGGSGNTRERTAPFGNYNFLRRASLGGRRKDQGEGKF
jgi:hypothetical protein